MNSEAYHSQTCHNIVWLFQVRPQQLQMGLGGEPVSLSLLSSGITGPMPTVASPPMLIGQHAFPTFQFGSQFVPQEQRVSCLLFCSYFEVALHSQLAGFCFLVQCECVIPRYVSDESVCPTVYTLI